ncbi:MAG: cupin domain-containing protein [Fidelibacterota bacterium]
MYLKKHLDFAELPDWLSFLQKDLDLKGVGIGIAKLPAGKGYTYLHSHKQQEEVYIPLAGKGIIHVDGTDIPLQPGDFVKVSPEAKRALKAVGDSKLVCLIVGGVPGGFSHRKTSNALIDDGILDREHPAPWYKNS